jgi:Ni,Fe-hydrogenase maturation factor
VSPASEISFSTHALTMGSLLALCARLYGKVPRAYAMALPGYAFDVNAELSPGARANLERAVHDLLPLLR